MNIIIYVGVQIHFNCQDATQTHNTCKYVNVIQLHHKYANCLFKGPLFVFECFYDQQDSYSYPKASLKTAINTKVCSSKSANFVILSFFGAYYSMQLYEHSASSYLQKIKLFTALSGCCQLCRTSLSNLIHMHTFLRLCTFISV